MIEIGALGLGIQVNDRDAIARLKRVADAAKQAAAAQNRINSAVTTAAAASRRAISQVKAAQKSLIAARTALSRVAVTDIEGTRAAIQTLRAQQKALRAAQERAVVAKVELRSAKEAKRAYSEMRAAARAAAVEARAIGREQIAAAKAMRREMDAAARSSAISLGQFINAQMGIGGTRRGDRGVYTEQMRRVFAAQQGMSDDDFAKAKIRAEERAAEIRRLNRRSDVVEAFRNADAEAAHKKKKDAEVAANDRRLRRETAREQRALDQRLASTRRRLDQMEAARRRRLAVTANVTSRAMMGRGGGIGGGMGLSTLGITATAIGTLGLAELVRVSNEMQVIQQRLAQVAGTQGEVRVLFNEIADSARRLRVPIGETTELFVKLRQSNANVGMTTRETLRVTEAFSAALRISGATGQTAASALLQFGQAMAKGNLDGDEFRTIAENNSEVLRVLERQLGKTRGELLKMRENGELTAKMLADALNKEMDELVQRAAKLAPTLGQGATNLRNGFLVMITNSRDAREAIEKLAVAMSDLGDFLAENGPLIQNIGELVLKLTALNMAARAIPSSLRGVIAWVRLLGTAAAGSAVGLGTLAGSIIAVALAARQMKEYREQQRETAKMNGLLGLSEQNLNLAVAERARRLAILEQRQRELNAQTKEAAKSGKMFAVNPEESLELARRIKIERDELGKLSQALEEVRAKRKIEKDGSDVVSPPPDAGNLKEAKDDTDQFLAAVLQLTKANEQRAVDEPRLLKIREQEIAVTKDATVSAERLAQAYNRLETIREILVGTAFQNEALADSTEVAKTEAELLAENLDTLQGSLTQVQVLSLLAYLRDLRSQMQDGLLPLERKIELLGKIKDLEKQMAKAQGDGNDEDERGRRRLTALEQYLRNIRRQLVSALADAPADLTVAFAEAWGERLATGVSRIGDRLRQEFAKVMGSVGQGLIREGFARFAPAAADFFKPLGEALLSSLGAVIKKMGITTGVFGKLLTKLKAAMANPLVAGPAMVAIGAAMVAFGSAMSNIGQGGSGGAFAGGTIGGLNVGGPEPAAQIFRFGEPRQFAGQTASDAQQPIVMNATIIGPSDPVAQRQIADMVAKAARRGIRREA